MTLSSTGRTGRESRGQRVEENRSVIAGEAAGSKLAKAQELGIELSTKRKCCVCWVAEMEKEQRLK